MVSLRSFAALGLCLIAGLAVFGWQIGRAVQHGRSFDRFLTVRGLSEREEKADLAIWPIMFSVQSEDLAGLKGALEEQRQKVVRYLHEQGIQESEITYGLPAVSDREESRLRANLPSLPRYQATATLSVRSASVDVVKKAIQQADRLLDQGVTIDSGSGYREGVEFVFTRVNAVKPDMIKEATANARLAAEKFAQDSNSRVGAIRQATQGVLDIESIDSASPERKLLRVVTTVQFFLE